MLFLDLLGATPFSLVIKDDMMTTIEGNQDDAAWPPTTHQPPRLEARERERSTAQLGDERVDGTLLAELFGASAGRTLEQS